MCQRPACRGVVHAGELLLAERDLGRLAEKRLRERCDQGLVVEVLGGDGGVDDIAARLRVKDDGAAPQARGTVARRRS